MKMIQNIPLQLTQFLIILKINPASLMTNISNTPILRLCCIWGLLLLHLLLNPYNSFAQNSEPCLFDHLFHKPGLFVGINQTQLKKSSGPKLIPVVVHVIHNGGSENISDNQIQSQIDVLNEDFRKISGTKGDGLGADTEIEFKLARKTPDGKCTNGIVRIKSSLTNHQNYQRKQLSDLTKWDSKRYLNIYIVKSINNGSGTLGYAAFPDGPEDQDGIVVLYNAFGRTGTLGTSSKFGRTATHEIGHWLGLFHTFNSGCGDDTCTAGDLVCDTPPAADPNFGCPDINSCSNDVPDIKDQVTNYMDYSDDGCKNMFSAGQKSRMQNTLSQSRNYIWTAANISSTGLDSSNTDGPCNVIADFSSNGRNICKGSVVQFINKSLNTPTGYVWSFEGGVPSTSTLSEPTVKYDSLGDFKVKLRSVNSVGTDSVEYIGYIKVSAPSAGDPLPFQEPFENFGITKIIVDNPDSGITWEITNKASWSEANSIRVNNLINTNYGQADALIIPGLDLTTFSGIPYITFKWAYARSDANYSDELIVLLSKDCGLNYSQIFYRTGSTLVTGPTQTTEFIPDSSQWKSAAISLSSYTSYNNIIIKIVNVTDGGNCLYIDNLNVGEKTLGTQDLGAGEFAISPNPVVNDLIYQVPVNLKGELSIKVINNLGEIIAEQTTGSRDSNFSGKVDMSFLPAGLYFLSFESTEGRSNYKIIKL